MASKKKQLQFEAPAAEPKPAGQTFNPWQYAWGRGRLFTVSLICAALIGGSAVWAWRNYSPRLKSDPDYVVTADKITVEPTPPPGVPGDLKLQALRTASLDAALPLLDERLTPRIAEAFSLHPWIERVARVEKGYPAHVKVEVVYRRPKLMVEVRNQAYAVDGAAVLLPGEDIRADLVRGLPRLAGHTSPPSSPAGLAWNDPVIAAAARLASFFPQTEWQKLGLEKIRLLTDAALGGHRAAPEFELLTATGQRIVWGHGPGEEAPGESPAEQKLSSLLSYFGKQPELAPPGTQTKLDLRTPLVAVPAEQFPAIVGFGQAPR